MHFVPDLTAPAGLNQFVPVVQTAGAMVVVSVKSIVTERETAPVTMAVVRAVREVAVGVIVLGTHAFVSLQIVVVVLSCY